MAAKKKETTEKTSTSVFDDIIEQEFTEVKNLSEEDTSVNYWVDTGNWALNYIISKKFKGGYPGGRISNFWGRSGTGKSMLPAIASKSKQWGNLDLDQFDRILVIDSEGGGTGTDLFNFVGAPRNKVRYIDTISTLDSYKISKETGKKESVPDRDVPKNLETPTYLYKRGLLLFLKKIVQAMEYNGSKEKLLIIIDSISNIKSFRAAIEGVEDVGKTNKLYNSLFALDNDFHNIDATVLLASKVYTNINNPYDPWIMSGGEAMLYNPSVNLKLTSMSESDELSEAEQKAEKERRKTSLGNSMKVVRATVTKSRFGTEGRNAWVILDSTYGLVRNSGLFKLLVDFDVCKKSGTRYTIPGVFENEKGEPISFYKKDFLKLFGQNENENIEKLQVLMEKREQEIKEERISLNVNDISEVDEEAKKTEETDEDFASSILNTIEAETEGETMGIGALD